jgi:paraquat-inducible protein A
LSEFIACKTCGQVHQLEPLPAGTVARCVRCGDVIERRTRHSLHTTAAFSLAALLLYGPANIFPILRITSHGITSENTVWRGTHRLFLDGDYFIATVVFLASIVIPLLKLIGLFTLVICTWLNVRRGKALRTWLYNAIEGIGRWAMLDVFVVAVLVSLVKLQRLAAVFPGKGLLAFTLVVLFTLFASASFDPQLIWEKSEVAQ